MERGAITAANQVNSPLLRLPGEMGNRIYDFVFCSKNTTRNAFFTTCKQAGHEAGPIYYFHIDLSFFDFADIKNTKQMRQTKQMMARAKPELLARVRSICTSDRSTMLMSGRIVWGIPWNGNADCFVFASHLPGLRYWHFNGLVHPTWEIEVVKGIKKLMDRDIEVTFDLAE